MRVREKNVFKTLQCRCPWKTNKSALENVDEWHFHFVNMCERLEALVSERPGGVLASVCSGASFSCLVECGVPRRNAPSVQSPDSCERKELRACQPGQPPLNGVCPWARSTQSLLKEPAGGGWISQWFVFCSRTNLLEIHRFSVCTHHTKYSNIASSGMGEAVSVCLARELGKNSSDWISSQNDDLGSGLDRVERASPES